MKFSRGFAIVCGMLSFATFVVSAAAQNPPIKIGVVYPLTGPVASQGGPARDAVKQAFDEVKYEVAGRKIELVCGDSQARPDTGLTKFKEMVEGEHVDFLLSEMASVVGAAVAPYVNEQKIVWVNTVAMAALTRELRSPYTFRFAPSAAQAGGRAAEWAKSHGWKKAYFIGWNAPAGREAARSNAPSGCSRFLPS
jgi:branched-chain amino acid transport system substrate-binding protein